MSKAAHTLVRSVLGEAYTGPIAGVLLKYHLIDQTGNLRVVTTGAEPDKGKKGETGPIVDPEVIDRLAALDPSNGKRLFDWIIFASAGGEPHIKESERSLELAKDWVIQNRMKGLSADEQQIKPMTRQEAEADWQANSYPKFYLDYFFADQDLAADLQYPCFGWFKHWPGRNSVYQKVVDAVTKWAALAKDKKFIQQWNRVNPKAPFQLTMWDGDKPRYKDVDALVEFVGTVKATIARKKAEQNIVTVGHNPEGGYRTGSDEVLYEDDFLKVVVPLTAAAALKKGFNDWCVANNSRWDTYFRSRRREDLMWGTYNNRGPFAFLTFKKHLEREPLTRMVGWPQSDKLPDLPMLAAHIQLSQQPNADNRIDFWDMANRQALRTPEIEERIRKVLPGALRSFKKAIVEIEDWLEQFKEEQLERFPNLEAMAQQLVASMLDD